MGRIIWGVGALVVMLAFGAGPARAEDEGPRVTLKKIKRTKPSARAAVKHVRPIGHSTGPSRRISNQTPGGRLPASSAQASQADHNHAVRMRQPRNQQLEVGQKSPSRHTGKENRQTQKHPVTAVRPGGATEALHSTPVLVISFKFVAMESGRKLSLGVVGFPPGEKLIASISINGTSHQLGEMVVTTNKAGNHEAVMELSEKNWLAGLPEIIPVGSVVTVTHGSEKVALTLDKKS
ncbi:MAG: hypothetical protein C5B49_12310 [Bdellovibrio sp.]|nr:MAG: hypothetical protein C5B49_12310 [Bdellovibrio sp.]